MDALHRQKIEQIEIELLNIRQQLAQAKNSGQYGPAAELSFQKNMLENKLKVLNQTTCLTEELAMEINILIDRWKSEFDQEIDEIGSISVTLDYINREIESLLIQYSLELGNEDSVFGVPISLCLNTPINNIAYNGGNYSAVHNISTWVKHIAGVELSKHVSTNISDPVLIELVTKYWESCLSRMSKFD